MKNKKSLLVSVVIMMTTFLLFSCEMKDDIAPQDKFGINYQDSNEPMLVLGKQKQNPYSLESMRKAYANLTANKRVADFDIQTTDLYVRFLPADSAELERLLADTSMIFWDYPLDFEVEHIGHYYHDPSVPDSLPTYQYTVVKPDFQFPDIQYQLLAELFLPDNYNIENAGGKVSSSFLEELEYEALRITGNLDTDDSSPNGRTASSKWRPSGRVRVREVIDNVGVPAPTNNWLPVVNVLVKAKRWFNLSDAYTNTQGDYTLGEFRGAVDYKIEFESDRVKVTNFLGWSRNHNGPNNRESGWNPDFDWWSESWANATVLNAAFACREQVNLRGMQTPFPVSWWAGSGRAVNKLNIRIKYDEGTGRMISKPWSINEIKIWTDWGEGSNRNGHKSTDFLYRVTFHELGHSMHARLNGSIAFTSKIIRESWADFIEHFFILAYYPAQGDNSGKQREDRPDWVDGYTPLFIDLMDADNQFARFGGNRPDDRVQNYTFLQLQESLVRNNRLREVRNHLRGYNNPTSGALDDLFNFYLGLE